VRKKLTVLIVLFFAGLILVQSIQAKGLKLLKLCDEIWDVLRMSGKFSDEAVDVIRMTGKFTDEAMEVLRLSGRWGDDALEVLRIGGLYGDEAIDALHIGGRYSDEVIDSLRIGSRYSKGVLDMPRMGTRHSDEVLDGVSAGVNRGQRTWKRVYVDEFGDVYDTSPEGMAAFLEKYDQMIANGATHADAKAAATVVQEQMDNICLNGYTLNTVDNY
jgi:hypothetical protein